METPYQSSDDLPKQDDLFTHKPQQTMPSLSQPDTREPFSYEKQRDKWLAGEKSPPLSQGDSREPFSYQKQRDKWLSEDDKRRPGPQQDKQSECNYCTYLPEFKSRVA